MQIWFNLDLEYSPKAIPIGWSRFYFMFLLKCLVIGNLLGLVVYLSNSGSVLICKCGRRAEFLVRVVNRFNYIHTFLRDFVVFTERKPNPRLASL